MMLQSVGVGGNRRQAAFEHGFNGELVCKSMFDKGLRMFRTRVKQGIIGSVAAWRING
jgi:hypothetical protein